MPNSKPHRRIYGQYFTPPEVVACCFALLAGALPAEPAIVDPACGDGAFLGYALASGLAPAARLSGCDLDPALVDLLHAQGLAGARLADGLDPAALPAGAFDLVVGNPPFGVATSRLGQPALASEVRFLLRALELARPGGLVALVLPNGVLANERLAELRAGLLARAAPLAVIGLPRATFRASGTHAQCSLLVLRNAPAAAGQRVFFGLAERLDQLAELARAYQAGAGQAGSSWFWLAHSPALARRLDAQFWQPEQRELAERLAARHALRPLGELLDRRHELIAGDHVRRSLGESRGAGLPYEYYQTREFMPAGYNYAQLERCDERAYRRLRYTGVQRHDVLVSCAGVGGAGRGRVCLITHTPGPSCTGDVLILRPRRLNPVVLFLFLCSRAGRTQLLRWQNGVGTVNLSADELLRVELPLLPEPVQRDLAARHEPVAAAHAEAMAALARGDAAGYAQARGLAEQHLAALVADVDALALGDW